MHPDGTGASRKTAPKLIENLRPTLVPMQEYLDEVAEILATGWSTRGRRRHLLKAATRHAVDFQAWRSLTRDDRVTRAEAIELIVGLVETAVAPLLGTAK